MKSLEKTLAMNKLSTIFNLCYTNNFFRFQVKLIMCILQQLSLFVGLVWLGPKPDK